MTGMLASVSSLAEAQSVLSEQVDIIDLKNPKAGSLGSLPVAQAGAIVSALNGQCRTSATIGDLPMRPDLIHSAISAMVGTGVNYIKIGFFPEGDYLAVLSAIAPLAAKHPLIAVVFADSQFDCWMVDAIKASGFAGIMLDTLDKTLGSLTEMLALAEIQRFVAYAKSKELICGLAGSLSIADIPLLLPFQPDYLGFRGALCQGHDRMGELNRQSVRAIRQAIVGACP